MKIKLLLAALLFILFSAEAANAQHSHGYRGRGYHRSSGVVVVTPPAPRVVIRTGPGYRSRGYNHGRAYGHRGYYGRPHRGHARGHYRRY